MVYWAGTASQVFPDEKREGAIKIVLNFPPEGRGREPAINRTG